MSNQFHPLRVIDVARETDDAVALTLEPDPAHRDKFGFTAGQHLILRKEIDGTDIRRNYSLFVSPDEGTLRVAVKRIDGGVFSNWAVSELKAGDVIEAMTPRGHFTWTFSPDQRRNYVAFAGGSGITPILSLVKTGLLVEPESRFILLYGNRTSASIMFLEDIAALKNRYIDRLQVYHFLNRETDDIDLFNGRLDGERIAEVLSTLVDPARIDAAFICGPGAMMDTAEAALVEAGVDPAAVMVERFSAGRPEGALTAQAAQVSREAEGTMLEIRIDGRRRTVAFDAAEGNILDSARAAGLPAPFACKAGVCATCRAKLVSGDVRMTANYGLSKEEVAAGYILTCQAIPVGDGVVVDYDA